MTNRFFLAEARGACQGTRLSGELAGPLKPDIDLKLATLCSRHGFLCAESGLVSPKRLLHIGNKRCPARLRSAWFASRSCLRSYLWPRLPVRIFPIPPTASIFESMAPVHPQWKVSPHRGLTRSDLGFRTEAHSMFPSPGPRMCCSRPTGSGTAAGSLPLILPPTSECTTPMRYSVQRVAWLCRFRLPGLHRLLQSNHSLCSGPWEV